MASDDNRPQLQDERATRIQVESDTAFLRVMDALDRKEIKLPREIREKIAQLEKLATVGLFTASISHEIKNALVGVKTCVQLAETSELGPLANREVLRIESLVNLLSQYVSKNRQSFGPLDVNTVIRNATRSLESVCAGKSLSLQIDLQAAPDTITGNGMQLEQALLNLILNAVEATPAGGTVAVRSFNDSDGVHIEVRDSGPGIPAEDLNRIFEPFYSTKARGSGLGLGITRRIIRDHDGTIEVASEPGRGASFTLSFPARPD